jgi:hypothetical protein
MLDIPLSPVVVVDKWPIFDDEDPRDEVVGEVSWKVVQEVDDAAAHLQHERQIHLLASMSLWSLTGDWWNKHTMVRFMTRLGIKGNLAYRHSQVKKAIMVIPPTTNMAIKDPGKRFW